MSIHTLNFIGWFILVAFAAFLLFSGIMASGDTWRKRLEFIRLVLTIVSMSALLLLSLYLITL